MKRRMVEMLCSIAMVILGTVGVLLQCGLFSETGFDVRQIGLMSNIATILLVIYELFQIRYLRKHKKGVFFAYLKCSTFLMFTFQFLVGQIVLKSVYQGGNAELQMAYLILHGILPVIVFTDWLAGEKGHFHTQFLVSAPLLPLLYVIVVMIIGNRTKWYPYLLINAAQLGYWMAAQTLIFLALLYLVYAAIIVTIDQYFYKREKKQHTK